MFSQVYSTFKVPPVVVVDFRALMSKFVPGVSREVVKECRTAMMVKKMYISRLMVHLQ